MDSQIIRNIENIATRIVEGDLGPDIDVIGEGSYGTVYKYGSVAIKIPKEDNSDLGTEIATEIKLRELEETKKIKLPNTINRILWIGKVQGKRYTVMPYLKDYYTLGYLLADKLTKADKDKIYKQLSDTLTTLHSHDFVHFDLNENNIMINNQSKKICIIDFGLSCSPGIKCLKFEGKSDKSKNPRSPPEVWSEIPNDTLDLQTAKKVDLYYLAIYLVNMYSTRFVDVYNFTSRDNYQKAVEVYLNAHREKFPAEALETITVALDVNVTTPSRKFVGSFKKP